MKARKTLTLIVGTIQSVIAILIMIFACFVFFNFLNVRSLLGDAINLIDLHMFIFLMSGIISFISGIFLLCEWWEAR